MNDDEYVDVTEGRQVIKRDGGKPSAINPSDALAFMGKFFDYGREATITKREIERYRTMRDIAITEITKKYEAIDKLINKTFEERRKVIEKEFEVIDKGLETHDYQLVNMGLQHLTTMLKDNPFRLFQITTPAQRKNMLEDGDLSVE